MDECFTRQAAPSLRRIQRASPIPLLQASDLAAPSALNGNQNVRNNAMDFLPIVKIALFIAGNELLYSTIVKSSSIRGNRQLFFSGILR